MKTSTTSTESIDTSEEMSVIYKFDLRDPYGYFLSQKFPIVNNDVIYIGNAETVELLKLLNIVNPSSVTTINTRQVGN
jgi:polysaccharide export outer membrane protein